MSDKRVFAVGRIRPMTAEPTATVSVEPSAAAAREVAPWSVIVYRSGREYHALSADTMHEIGQRMIAIGRSHMGPWWRRWRQGSREQEQ